MNELTTGFIILRTIALYVDLLQCSVYTVHTFSFLLLYLTIMAHKIIAFLSVVVPSPMVSVEAVGIPVRNESFALVCTGSAPPNVLDIATVSVQWQLNSTEFTNSTLEGISITMNSETMATLLFPSLNASIHERNDYNCVATLSITGVPTTKAANETYRLLSLSKTDSVNCTMLLFFFS